MEIVVKDSFKVVGIVVESDWQNIHQKMAVAWQEFKQRVGEIEQRKGNHFLDISLAVNDGIFQQMICVEVDKFPILPAGMRAMEIPQQTYIYFKHEDSVITIDKSFGQMYDWAEANGYHADDFKLDVGYIEPENTSHELYLRVQKV